MEGRSVAVGQRVIRFQFEIFLSCGPRMITEAVETEGKVSAAEGVIVSELAGGATTEARHQLGGVKEFVRRMNRVFTIKLKVEAAVL